MNTKIILVNHVKERKRSHFQKKHREKISKAQLGKKKQPCAENTKKKLREINLGKKYPSRKKPEPFSKEHRKKLSESHKGEKSSLWKGGEIEYSENIKIRCSLDYRFWREDIFKRDNFICQKCKKRGVYLEAHHIYNFADYPKLRLSIKNGITLCRECHIAFHNKYSRKNNTKSQIAKYIENYDVQL